MCVGYGDLVICTRAHVVIVSALRSKFPAMKGPLHWPEKFSKTKESVWSSVLDHLDKYKPCFNVRRWG